MPFHFHACGTIRNEVPPTGTGVLCCSNVSVMNVSISSSVVTSIDVDSILHPHTHPPVLIPSAIPTSGSSMLTIYHESRHTIRYVRIRWHIYSVQYVDTQMILQKSLFEATGYHRCECYWQPKCSYYTSLTQI